ncbi:MAG: accessory Sec system translocase SecA2 [Candidatus Aminicenantes bacterium]|nr:accessory Sec system translocase SecA2 [Candidatus Aminicenantes bacterium]
MTGHPVEMDLSGFERTLERIKARRLENEPARALIDMSKDLRERARSGTALDDLRIEAFALVREASRRTVRLDPFDPQIIAGLAMAEGKIVELPTGEGKTLAAVFPAYLHALTGSGVHVLTFNDYLARRDAAWMGPIYELLGLSVGCVQEGQDSGKKRTAYARDVTYATAKEVGFDYLRGQLVGRAEDIVLRPFHLALVDEADSILVDEARIPLLISGLTEAGASDALYVARHVERLRAGTDFQTDEARTAVSLTDAGLDRLERALGRGGLYDDSNQALLAAVHCALHAHVLLQRDVDYIVRNGKVEIVDEFTGRVVDKRHWPDGLQAAVEAKENLSRRGGGTVLGSITVQHFLGLYPTLAGMTATARSSADELREFYGRNVVVVPPNRPCIRVDEPDEVFPTRAAKREALVREVAAANAAGRPMLVGTASVRESEELAEALRAVGVGCRVLNAKNDEEEAGIIARAGRPGAVTISTNMAGRGTDIRLGGAGEEEKETVAALGGLYVIGTNRHESLRIDHQLRGRAGRQGDPGSSKFFISFEDEIFERYGLGEALSDALGIADGPRAVSSRRLNREIAHGQRLIEARNFNLRKTLWEFSHLVELQRRMVAARRESALSGEGVGTLASLDPALHAQCLSAWGKERLEKLEKRVALYHLDRGWAEHLAWIQEVREGIHLVSLGGRSPLEEFRKSVTEAFLEMRQRADQAILRTFRSLVRNPSQADVEAEALKGPSSTWTYLVSDDQSGWGIGLLQGKNIGASAIAAGIYGPLFLFTLFLGRRRRNRRKKKGSASKP